MPRKMEKIDLQQAALANWARAGQWLGTEPALQVLPAVQHPDDQDRSVSEDFVDYGVHAVVVNADIAPLLGSLSGSRWVLFNPPEAVEQTIIVSVGVSFAVLSIAPPVQPLDVVRRLAG